MVLSNLLGPARLIAIAGTEFANLIGEAVMKMRIPAQLIARLAGTKSVDLMKPNLTAHRTAEPLKPQLFPQENITPVR